MHRTDLGSSLRAWRDRLGPAEAGLPVGPRRRAPGLRRQELANLAGLSVEYLARLEQGRAGRPSAAVLGPLARALRLTDDERDHLFRLAGHASPAPGIASTHVTPGVQRIIDRLHDAAVVVVDPVWTVVLANPLAVALLGDDVTGGDGEPNVLRRHFTGRPSRVVRTPDEAAAFEAYAAADLRASLARYPQDPRIRPDSSTNCAHTAPRSSPAGRAARTSRRAPRSPRPSGIRRSAASNWTATSWRPPGRPCGWSSTRRPRVRATRSP